MTFVTAVILSALRAALITAVVLIVSRHWSRTLDDRSARGRSVLWGLILIPGLVPELLLGYAYTPWVVGQPARAEVVCAVLLGLRLLSVGVIAWQLAPPSPLSPSAWHLRSLSPRLTWSSWLTLCWIGPIRRAILPTALVWLLAFQEFELAALMKAVSWTDALFTEQQFGRAFRDLVLSALGPALLQMVVIAGAMQSLSKESRPGVPRLCQPCEGSQRVVTVLGRGRLVMTLIMLVVVWGLLVMVPLSSLMEGLPAAFVQLAEQPLRWHGLLRELGGGLAVSVAAACLAWSLAAWCESPPAIDRGPRHVVGIIACLPGLSGSLVLSLGMLTVFQRTSLAALYNTPVMWLLSSILFLLPRAMLLRLWLARADTSAIAVARLLVNSPLPEQRRSGRALLWRLETEPRFLAVCCLVYWSYLELMFAALLAPTGLPSGLVRLYNFLHFGRTAALSAEMTILLGGPLLFAAAVWGLARRGRV